MKTLVKHAIFDLDGTLYEFNDTSFGSSLLGRKVRYYHASLLSAVSHNPEDLLIELCAKEKEQGIPVSVSVAELIECTRQDVFDLTWGSLKPDEIISGEKIDPDFLMELRSKGIKLTLLTAGPAIWANKALEFLRVKTLFDTIFTAELYSSGKQEIFKTILHTEKGNAKTIVSIGDQEYSDIVPAQQLGMRTHLVTGPEDIYVFFD